MNVRRLRTGPFENVGDVCFKVFEGQVAEIFGCPRLEMVQDHQVLVLRGWGIPRNIT